MHKLREMLVISILHTHARILSPLDNKKVCFSSRSTLSRLLDVVDRALGNCRRGFLGVRHLASLDRVVGVLAGRRTLHHLAGVDVRGRVLGGIERGVFVKLVEKSKINIIIVFVKVLKDLFSN